MAEKQERNSTDWELVERDYRAGIKTLRQIGDERGISHTAIQKKAKRSGWARGKAPSAARADRSVPVSKLEPLDEFSSAGFVYGIYFDAGDIRYFKVGLAKSPVERLNAHQISLPFEAKIAIAYFVPDMRHEERTLHEAFAAKRVRGEWFALSGEDLDFMASRARLV